MMDELELDKYQKEDLDLLSMLQEGVDPWGTAMGKAYLGLFRDVSSAMFELEQKRVERAYELLILAQQRAEEILMDYNHPLDTYIDDR